MATTPEFGFRYPDGSDNVDIPTGIQELAFDVEDTLSSDYLTKAGGSLTGALTVPYGIDGGIHIGGSGPRDMAGTGSPEGVVTAPAASTWRDTNATTGAVKWIKASGAGNTGWKVEYGDTGFRNVAAGLLVANGFTTVTGMQIRRTGNRVDMTAFGMYRAAPGSGVFYTLPSGFRPAYICYAKSYSDNPCYVSSNAAHMVMAGTSDAGVSFAYTTNDAWPSTLPGT